MLQEEFEEFPLYPFEAQAIEGTLQQPQKFSLSKGGGTPCRACEFKLASASSASGNRAAIEVSSAVTWAVRNSALLPSIEKSIHLHKIEVWPSDTYVPNPLGP